MILTKLVNGTAGISNIKRDAGWVLGMKTFGASAPLKELQNKFGLAPENVVAAAKKLLNKTTYENEPLQPLQFVEQETSSAIRRAL